MWIGKEDGMIVYITGIGKKQLFLQKQKMFEELIEELEY